MVHMRVQWTWVSGSQAYAPSPPVVHVAAPGRAPAKKDLDKVRSPHLQALLRRVERAVAPAAAAPAPPPAAGGGGHALVDGSQLFHGNGRLKQLPAVRPLQPACGFWGGGGGAAGEQACRPAAGTGRQLGSPPDTVRLSPCSCSSGCGLGCRPCCCTAPCRMLCRRSKAPKGEGWAAGCAAREGRRVVLTVASCQSTSTGGMMKDSRCRSSSTCDRGRRADRVWCCSSSGSGAASG